MPPYRLSARHLPSAAATLQAAFAPDPLMRWVFDSPAHYARAGHWFMEAQARHALLFGEVWATPGLGAVAVWLAPMQDAWSRARLRLSGLADMPNHIGAAAHQRYMELVNLLEAEPYPPGQFWYLLMLGVHPHQQRRGLGTVLVQHGLRRADIHSWPVTLETNNPVNLSFYAAQGFQVYAPARLQTGVEIWGMARPPIRP